MVHGQIKYHQVRPERDSGETGIGAYHRDLQQAGAKRYHQPAPTSTSGIARVSPIPPYNFPTLSVAWLTGCTFHVDRKMALARSRRNREWMPLVKGQLNKWNESRAPQGSSRTHIGLHDTNSCTRP